MLLLLWCVSTDCSADYLRYAEREQTGSCGLHDVDGSFTYFTTCIEGGAGRVNDSVALHGGNVSLDNLQLQTTTTTNNRQITMVVKTQWVIRNNKMGPKRRGKKTDDLQEQERKRQRSERTLYWLITGNKEAPVTRGVASCNQEAGRNTVSQKYSKWTNTFAAYNHRHQRLHIWVHLKIIKCYFL